MMTLISEHDNITDINNSKIAFYIYQIYINTEANMDYKFKKYVKRKIKSGHLNMGGAAPNGERIDVNSLYFERGGKPWIGVMGEYHFSRADKNSWYRELCKMKAGGISIVSTYLFWIYHEEIEGTFDFTGDLDIRSFVEESKRAGLDVVLRIGPWAHGECRNGGFPDWLLEKPYKLRDNNPEYMAKVCTWYEKIYNEVKGLFYKDGGNIIAIQLENELTDGAEHLYELKKLAQKIGFDVPIYTVTGWNSAAGARIPVEEVVPVFGGYVEMPWSSSREQLPPSTHFFFNRMRNDSAIGADVISQKGKDGWQLPYEDYPFATCELGGGIENTHHRRSIIDPMDIYALSLVKLGCGNNLIGYYMYHGGTNKTGRTSFNESKATGYPNDYPVLSYDFQAPLSEYGEIRGHYRLLNMLHMFAADFGYMLAPMEAVEADVMPDINDTSMLRYAMRTNGKSGFIFVNHHQRHAVLEDIKGISIDTGSVVFPEFDVVGDKCFFMPFNMDFGGSRIEYATAQPLCSDGNTIFFAELPGIEAIYCIDGKEIKAAAGSVIKHSGITIVTLSYDEARYTRKLSGKVYIGNGCDLIECNGKLETSDGVAGNCKVWTENGFESISIKGNKKEEVIVDITASDQPFKPVFPEELNIGGDRSLKWYSIRVNCPNGFAEIETECDCAQLYVNGSLAADEFYYGVPWRIPASMIYGNECYIVCSELKDDHYREY